MAAALSAQQTDRARLLFELAGEPSHCTAACPRPALASSTPALRRQFYDRTCNNEQVKMQRNLPPEQIAHTLERMVGIEYDLKHADEVPQHGQSAVWAVPQLGSCASSGRVWQLWLARRSHGRDGPTGRPATASGARASRLQTANFHRL